MKECWIAACEVRPGRRVLLLLINIISARDLRAQLRVIDGIIVTGHNTEYFDQNISK